MKFERAIKILNLARLNGEVTYSMLDDKFDAERTYEVLPYSQECEFIDIDVIWAYIRKRSWHINKPDHSIHVEKTDDGWKLNILKTTKPK